MRVELNELPLAMRKQAEERLMGLGAKKGCENKIKVFMILGKDTCLSTDEGAEQEAFFRWAELSETKYPCLATMHHIPNGGMRNRAEAAKLKRQGVKKGVPDIFLPYACGGYNGLYIELKAKGGVLSDEQDAFLREVSKSGYLAAVCFGAESAIRLTENYITGLAELKSEN